MRRSDDMPLDPFEMAELEAIEAAVAGREVDPEHAELAELSILLATDQQHPSEAFTRELDARVARRFREPSAGRRSRSWIWRPAIGAGLTATLAAIVVLAIHSATPTGSNGPATSPGFRLAKPLTTRQLSHSNAGTVSNNPASNGAASSAKSGVASGAVLTPAPVPNGRRQIKSAQLTLATSGGRMDAVAQEVFNVTSRENGIVRSSQVTQGRQVGGGYATFNLSIPTSNLQDTLDQLSQLQYANVVSRTDATQDVNNRFISDQRRLADATALRNSLLKQLATAYTTAEIDSLKSQIHNAETSISRDEANLRSLQHQISYSSLSVEVNQSAIVPLANRRAASTGAGGLTLGQAAHDAGRVLVVAAGVILIGMAALVPIGLLVALVSWIAYSLRRRRREQALDAA
ncbi:MAG TPA: DUF4349 domain-containing protein [Solirubrobacteraceae bacterium]